MAEQKPGFRYIVRVAETDLDGNKPIIDALRKVKGVSFAMASAVCTNANIDRYRKAGEMPDAEVKKIDVELKSAAKTLPAWMLNRRRDPETGEDKHLLTTDIAYHKEFDIRSMKKVKSYRGMRHAFGLPVRGQRTKSNFRRNKGKSLGVAKKAAAGKKT